MAFIALFKAFAFQLANSSRNFSVSYTEVFSANVTSRLF